MRVRGLPFLMLAWLLRFGALLLGGGLFGIGISSTVAASETEAPSKWEVGVALGGQLLNDYRGSNEAQVSAYPVPFMLYRGSFFKADRNGVRGEFLANNRIELNISGETALNGQSNNNRLREGMHVLESAFELGPSVNINLSGDSFSQGWALRLPFRAAVTVGDSGIHSRGYTFNPRFTYTEPQLWGSWRARVNLGVLIASEKYHAYYYDVDTPFVTADRPYYQADAGFSGYYFKTSLGRARGDYWYGISLRYDNLSDAVFADSSLVETDDYFALSFVVAWIGWRSQQRAVNDSLE